MNNKVIIIAGPCAIESYSQMNKICRVVSSLGLSWVRGGAYKPRLSPHSFQGLGDEGIKILKDASKKYNLKSITEVIDEHSLCLANKHIDAMQIGTRNMTNYSLLKSIGSKTAKNKKLICLKRGMSAKVSELLSATEYITEEGNNNILLCERGIRTFEDSTRFTLDISSVPVIHKQSKYPVCVDVSHAAGNSDLVSDLACAALASGTDAIMLEIHPNPKRAKCDGAQQLNMEQFKNLIDRLNVLAKALDKELV